MNLCIAPSKYEQCVELAKNKNVYSLIIGYENFSQATSCNLSSQQLIDLNKNKATKKIWVLINKMFFESEINGLEKCLKFLWKIKVDKIIFSDYAVKQICDEKKIKIDLCYDGKTLNTNYGQLEFYKENDITSIALSNELSYNEIKEISNNKNTVELMIQIEGLSLISFSRWKLLTNYMDHINSKDDLKYKKLFLKENERTLPNIIYETDIGTYIFSGYNLSLIEYFDKILEMNIDYLKIDGFLNDDAWLYKAIDTYSNAYKFIQNNKFTDYKSSLAEEIKKNNVEICSDGFFGSNYLHTRKENE